MRKILIAILVLLLCSLTIGSSGLYLKEEAFYQRYGVSAEGLVLWLDQSDGRSYGDVGNWYDLSGNGNHATQGTGANQPAITGAAGLAGSCRDFDGGDDTLITTLNVNDLDRVGKNCTLMVWVRIDNSAAIDQSIISAARSGYQLLLTYSYQGTGFEFLTQISPDLDFASVGVPTDTGWHYVVGVMRSGNLELYVDGILKDSTVSTIGIALNEILIVGAKTDSSPVHFLNGQISGGQIFSRALTAAEIQRMFLADAPRHGGL